MAEVIFVKSWEPAIDDSKSIFELYHSVEMKPAKALPIYQFKLYQTSEFNGACILVKKNSEVLNYLESGTEMLMNYYPNEGHNQTDCFKTRIKSISKDENAQYIGCVKVDLSILDDQ